jgi:uncharacterized protein YdeI (YjbR/CyaY-like superfamily)
VGQKVKISIEFDPQPPTYSMLEPLQKALDENPTAKAAFDAFTPGRQKEILRYLRFLKTEASLQQNIRRVIQHLQGQDSDALYPLFHHKQN